MASDKPQKISVGFIGGQVLSARVEKDQLARLRGSLGKVDGWFEFAAEDGTVVVDLGKIVYVLLDSEEHRVGFGA
jgi:hypothetical protein